MKEEEIWKSTFKEMTYWKVLTRWSTTNGRESNGEIGDNVGKLWWWLRDFILV